MGIHSSPELVDPMSCYEAHPVGEVRQEVVVTPPLVELPSMEHVIPPGSSPPSLTITDPPQAAAVSDVMYKFATLGSSLLLHFAAEYLKITVF